MVTTEEVLQRIKERRGYLLTSHRFMATEDPEYIELYEQFIQEILSKDKALTKKEKELLTVAMDAVLNYLPGLHTHMIRAFQVGATKAEVVEAIEVAGAFRTQALTIGIKMIQEVLDEIERQPVK